MAHVLCLFEQPAAIEQLANHLSEHQINFCSDPDSAIARLHRDHYDLFLCSAFLRSSSAEAILIRLRGVGVLDRTKVICIRDVMTPTAISCDTLIKQTTTALGASAYMSLDKLLNSHHQVLFASQH